jgi:microcin C transport system ATP-binding protein
MLLTIQDLNTWISTESALGEVQTNQILHDISLTIPHAQTVALVGESGSGKSVTALTILRLLEESNSVQNSGSIVFEQKDLLSLSSSEIRRIRGNRIAMVFQEPMTSLNPVYTIGNQLIEPLLLHQSLDKKEAKNEAIRLLTRTGIENPQERLHAFPHQLSGGQRQRAMIAMALACKPALLIADEPTTALDVTIQAQILELLADLQSEFEMAILLITHDLTMVRQTADHIHIMKGGKIVEHGPTEAIFTSPTDGYTKHLLRAVPLAA